MNKPIGLANLPPERRKEIASMGGKASPTSFKNNPALAKSIAIAREKKKREAQGVKT